MENSEASTQLCNYLEEIHCSAQIHQLEIESFPLSDLISFGEIKEFFGIQNGQSVVLLAYLIDRKISGSGGTASERRIAKEFRVRLRCLPLLKEALNELLTLGLIEEVREHFHQSDIEYRVHQSSIDAALKYDKSLLQNSLQLTFEDFIYRLDNIISKCEIQRYYDGYSAISILLTEYAECKEVKWMNSTLFQEESLVILSLTLRNYFANSEDGLLIDDIAKIAGKDRLKRYTLERSLMLMDHELFTSGLVRFEIDDFFGNKITLSEKCIEGLSSESIQLQKKRFVPQMFTMTSPLQLKHFAYLHDNQELRNIEKMVSQELYPEIKNKLSRLTILLTGKPGVGKTSFINHLARSTGRAILSANIAQILSAFVGESEKNLIKLFKEAHQANQTMEIAPIIVFDEAEVLLYSRDAKSTKAVDRMSNNIISLLLSNLDNFSGILICCSNFNFKNGGFDPALHRRFHIVSEIESPPTKVLLTILQNHFPELTEAQGAEFMSRYPYITPAQIAHIKDKYEVYQLLGNEGETLQNIDKIAAKDLLNHQKIGY